MTILSPQSVPELPFSLFPQLNTPNHTDLFNGAGEKVRKRIVSILPGFSSAKGAVDKMLEQEGKLVFINSQGDLNKVKIEKKRQKAVRLDNPTLIDFFVNLIESCGKRTSAV